MRLKSKITAALIVMQLATVAMAHTANAGITVPLPPPSIGK